MADGCHVAGRATAADMDALLALRAEAEAWLASAGIDQWRAPGFRDRALAKWRADVEQGRTWLVRDGAGAVAATVTLAPADPDFWCEDDRPGDAVYVAKLITARAFAGAGLGGRVLDWAGLAARRAGLGWVRLDCWRSNTALQEYYLGQGFRHVRTEAPAHRRSGWLAQRPAELVLHPERRLGTAPSGR
ncbi:GNAT family N-acetyltransferase [Streptomyces sp. HNM0574]|uniref:GNAT family N-acetyltransferase n=1 Tax=Streptomyces sp. HNM0574 TaxID=2714954 RepID=UPI00146BFB8C|nr:GNAT family N-acetyltransferase [Streptomyces sp. HNM0574]NLU69286.1 GNAT family N-acetyltransferase [Streptomyces sp. HNM0574]